MVNVQFNWENDVLFDRNFNRFGGGIKNFIPFWQDLVPDLRAIMLEQFQGQGIGPNGAWAPLTKQYAKRKARKYPGQPILQASGATFRALTTATANSIVVIGQTAMEFGVALPYPVFHQRGGKRLPRRPIFDFTDAQKTRITKTVHNRLVQIGQDSALEVS